MIEYAGGLLENGNIRDSSLTRAPLLHQITQAVKEIDRITGLYVAKVQVQHEHRTVKDMIMSLNEEGYFDLINGAEVEEADYEIVGDE